MGSLIMLKVPSLELSEVVSNDFSMEKISQALLKYVLTNIAKQKRNYDEEIDSLNKRCDQNQETGRNLTNATQVLADQLTQLSHTLGKVDADLRMRCAAIEENNEKMFNQLSAQLDKLDAEVSKAKSADGVSLRDKCILVAKFDKLDTTVRKQIEDADKVHSAKLDGYHTLSKQQVTEIKKALEKLDAVYQQRTTAIEDTIKRQVTQLVQSLGNVDSEFRKLLAQAGIMNWLEG